MASARAVLLAVLVLCAALGPALSKDCECEGHDCGCCSHIEIKDLHVNDTACANITYVPSDLALDVTVTLGNRSLVNKTVSLEDPDFCFGVPYIKKLAELCLDFSDMNVTKKRVSGCVDIEVKVLTKTLAKFDLGCFHFDVLKQWLLSLLQARHEGKGAGLPELPRLDGPAATDQAATKTLTDHH